MSDLYHKSNKKSNKDTGIITILEAGSPSIDQHQPALHLNPKAVSLVDSLSIDTPGKKMLHALINDTEESVKEGMKILDHQDCLITGIYNHLSHKSPDTIRAFNLCAGISTVSGVTKRFFRTESHPDIMNGRKVHLNFYTLLSASTGLGKTAALNASTELQKRACQLEPILKYPVDENSSKIGDIVSDAAMNDRLRKHPASTFTMDEAGKFLKTKGTQGSSSLTPGMISQMLNSYGNDGISSRVRAEIATEHTPDTPCGCISFHGATTPQQAREVLFNDGRDTDGFSNRFLIFEEIHDHTEEPINPVDSEQQVLSALKGLMALRIIGEASDPTSNTLPNHTCGTDNLIGYEVIQREGEKDDNGNLKPAPSGPNVFTTRGLGGRLEYCKMYDPEPHFRHIGFEEDAAQLLSSYIRALRHFVRANGNLRDDGLKEFGWLARGGEQLLRLAALFGVSEFAWQHADQDLASLSSTPMISITAVEKAFVVLRLSLISNRKLYEEFGSRTMSSQRMEHVEIREKILEKVLKAGPKGISATKLNQGIRKAKAEEVKKILIELREAGAIMTIIEGRSIKAFPVI